MHTPSSPLPALDAFLEALSTPQLSRAAVPAVHASCPMCRCACETIEQVRQLQEPLLADAPYAPDWIVQVVVDRGPSAKFRWYVQGINANCEPGAYGRHFYWSVPALSWRYDLSAAKLMTEAEALRTIVTETA